MVKPLKTLETLLSVSVLCVFCVDAEVFTASSDLTGAFQLELQIVDVLTRFAAQAQAKLDTIHR